MDKEAAMEKINQGDGDFQVFTKEEHETFLKNIKDTEVFKEQIDARISDLGKKYDDDLFSVLGKRTPEGQRTYEFMKHEVKDLLDTRKELEAKVSDLQKAVDDKSGTEALELAKSELESIRKKHQNANDEWKSKYDALEKDGMRMKIHNEFDRSMTGLKFKDEAIIPLDVRDAMINNAKTELAKSAQFVDGVLVFMGTDGKIMRDDNLNVLSAKEVLGDRLKSIIDAGRKQTGVDIKEPEIERDEDGKVKVTIPLPESVKTNTDLTEHLLRLGLKSGSEEYRAAYAKYIDKVKKVT